MDVTLLVAGDERVGKSSLLRRLAESCSGSERGASREAPSGCRSLKLLGQLSTSKTVQVELLECGPGGVERVVVDRLSGSVDGVFLVIDCASTDSLRVADDVLLFLTEHCQENGLVPICLIANKADCRPSAYVVTGPNLDLYARECGLAGWALTVGHHELGDLDAGRGVSLRNQKTIDEIFIDMIRRHVEKNSNDGVKVIAKSFKVEE